MLYDDIRCIFEPYIDNGISSVVMNNKWSNRVFFNSTYLLCKELVTYHDRNKNKKINQNCVNFYWKNRPHEI